MQAVKVQEKVGGKRERTRAALIEAAAALIREKGYEALTMAEVAARAGMTVGAIYGNFKNKDDLIVAVARARWRPIMPPVPPDVDLRGYLKIIAREVVVAARERRPTAVLAAAYRTYVLDHPELRDQIAREDAARLDAVAEPFARRFAGEKLRVTPRQFLAIGAVLIDGLLFAAFQSPETFDEETITAAILGLAP